MSTLPPKAVAGRRSKQSTRAADPPSSEFWLNRLRAPAIRRGIGIFLVRLGRLIDRWVSAAIARHERRAALFALRPRARDRRPGFHSRCWSRRSCSDHGTSSSSAQRSRSSAAISSVTSRDQPSAVLNATIRTGFRIGRQVGPGSGSSDQNPPHRSRARIGQARQNHPVPNKCPGSHLPARSRASGARHNSITRTERLLPRGLEVLELAAAD
jgi:hypothetical protein